MGKKFDVSKDVQFDLYTLRNPTTAQILTIDNTTSIDESNFNRELPTRIFIHGFQSKRRLKKALTDGKKIERNTKSKEWFLIIFGNF